MRRKTPTDHRCKSCKEAVVSTRIYCKRLGEYVEDVVYCPYFEPKHATEIVAVQ